MRLKSFTSVLVAAALIMMASGCGSSRSRRSEGAGRVRITRGGEDLGIDFDRYWPRDHVEKLSPRQRAKLLELALVGLKGNNWEHARDVLLALGKDSFPPLIAQVESTEETAAGDAPVPVVVRSSVKTLGELSHDVLLEIVQYHSNFKGQMPARSREQWSRWWEKNGSDLIIK